ncbi:MAG: helix-turn-helix transcriptional regulator [Ferruginibacter sp.]
MNYFKTNLRYLHKIFDLNQADIATTVNKQRTTIGNWESGLSEPNLEELIILSKFFDIRLDILVLVNIEKAQLITEQHIVEFTKKGKLKNHPVNFDTTDLAGQELAEPDESALWQVLDELKSLKNNMGKLRVEIRKGKK